MSEPSRDTTSPWTGRGWRGVRYLLRPARCAAIALFLCLTGCGGQVDQLLDKLAGKESQTVVLAGSPLTIGPEGVSFTSKEPMKVLGNSVGICLVFESGVELTSWSIMDEHYKAAFGEATLSGTIKVSDGKSFDLGRPGQAWREFGVVTDRKEFSACLSCACGPRPQVGAEISEVTLRSSSPVQVKGVYWESTNAFDNIRKNKR